MRWLVRLVGTLSNTYSWGSLSRVERSSRVLAVSAVLSMSLSAMVGQLLVSSSGNRRSGEGADMCDPCAFGLSGSQESIAAESEGTMSISATLCDLTNAFS